MTFHFQVYIKVLNDLLDVFRITVWDRDSHRSLVDVIDTDRPSIIDQSTINQTV